jgi:hypothetical protein
LKPFNKKVENKFEIFSGAAADEHKRAKAKRLNPTSATGAGTRISGGVLRGF